MNSKTAYKIAYRNARLASKLAKDLPYMLYHTLCKQDAISSTIANTAWKNLLYR